MYNNNLQLPKKDKLSKRALARMLGLSHSTFNDEISRGLAVNPSIRNDSEIYEYSAEKAQAHIRKGSANKGCGMKMTNKLAAELRKGIVDEKKSPTHIRRDMIREGWMNVPCVKSIYNHIHHGDIGVACDQTPYKLKKKAKGKRRSRRKPAFRPERLSIEKRPENIDNRQEFGHWEMDCIVSCVGGRGGLLILTERSTRYTVIVKIRAISQSEVLKAMRSILRRKLMSKVLTITTDNGSEFLDSIKIIETFAKINKMLRVYYAHAYCAWEKGSVENATAISDDSFPKEPTSLKSQESRLNTYRTLSIRSQGKYWKEKMLMKPTSKSSKKMSDLTYNSPKKFLISNLNSLISFWRHSPFHKFIQWNACFRNCGLSTLSDSFNFRKVPVILS